MAKSHPQGPSRNGSSAPGAPGHPGVTGPLFVGMNQLSPPPSTPMPPEACDCKRSDMARIAAMLRALGWQLVPERGIDTKKNGQRICIPGPGAGYSRYISGGQLGDLSPHGLYVWNAMNGRREQARYAAMSSLMQILNQAIHNRSLEDFVKMFEKELNGRR